MGVLVASDPACVKRNLDSQDVRVVRRQRLARRHGITRTAVIAIRGAARHIAERMFRQQLWRSRYLYDMIGNVHLLRSLLCHVVHLLSRSLVYLLPYEVLEEPQVAGYPQVPEKPQVAGNLTTTNRP